MEIKWDKVAASLAKDAEDIRWRSSAVDIDTAKEMRTRAALLESMSRALYAGVFGEG